MAAPRRIAVIGPVRALARSLPWALLFALGLSACRSLDRFDTGGPAAYCGSIVRGAQFQEGFIPAGAPPSLGVALELDTDALTTHPGSLRSNDTLGGLCSANGGALFTNAPLRAIEELFHDALSQVDLGDGHQHDFFAWVDSTCQGTMLAVVSLLSNGAVELRLLKPAPAAPADAPPELKAGFGLFYLERGERGCGF